MLRGHEHPLSQSAITSFQWHWRRRCWRPVVRAPRRNLRNRRPLRSPCATVIEQHGNPGQERSLAVSRRSIRWQYRPRVSGFVSQVTFERGRRGRRVRCCSRSIHGRSRLRSVGCAPNADAAGRRARAELAELHARSGSTRENAMSREEFDRRSVRARNLAQVDAVERGAAGGAELNLEFTRVTRRSPDASAGRSSPKGTWCRPGRAKGHC